MKMHIPKFLFNALSIVSLLTISGLSATADISPLDVEMTLATSSITSPGEPLVVHYKITNTSDEEVQTYMGSDYNEWLSHEIFSRLGQVTVSIYAQPYYFHDIGHMTNSTPVSGPSIDDTNGELHFHYAWLSTSGNLADLHYCTIHEYVTYSGGNPYQPSDPPFHYTVFNPETGDPTPGTSGLYDDNQRNPALHGGSFTTDSDGEYHYASYSGTQIFVYDDSRLGETNIQIPGPDSGPFYPTRTILPVDSLPPAQATYTVTKAGYTASYSF
jgi:hypothetical protein